jgi:hypothetical protein
MARSARVDPSNGTRIRLNVIIFLSVLAYSTHMNWRCGVTETKLRINSEGSCAMDQDMIVMVASAP